MRSGLLLRVFMFSIVGLMALPVAASATWPGANGKIFFTCKPIGGTFQGVDICSINPDGSALTNLTNTPDVGEYVPEVSRDGRQVVFTRGTSADTYRAWVMNADGSNPHQVTSVPTDGPAWTPGGQIAFRAKIAADAWEFQTVSSAGGVASPLWSAGVTGNSYPPRFTASGSFVYGKLAQIPATTTYTQQIFKVSGGSESQLTVPTAGINSNQQPSWSPDGATILFWRTTGVNADIWSVSSAGGSPVQVTTTPDTVAEEAFPSFSPDGQKLLWEHQDAGHDFFNRQIAIAGADGSSPTLLPIPGYTQATAPVWAPVPGGSPPAAPMAGFTVTASKKVKKGKTVNVSLRCIGDTRCAVAYGATVSVPVKGKRPKSFKIRSKSVTLAAKANRVVSLKVPASAKGPLAKALKNRKKPTIRITLVARDPDTGSLIRRITLSVKVTG